MSTVRDATAEFLATLLLVFTGCGALIAAVNETDSADNLQTALAWGFAYATLTQLFSAVYGVHMNPAVSLAFLVTRKITLLQFISKLLLQVVGAICGAAILDSVTGQKRLASLGVNYLSSATTSGSGFGMEFVITFIVVLALFALMEPQHRFPGSTHLGTLHYGAVISLVHLIALPFTRCSINPARSFGPAVISGEWSDHWVFWLGPLGGGALGGLVYALWYSSNEARMSFRDIFTTQTSESNKHDTTSGTA